MRGRQEERDCLRVLWSSRRRPEMEAHVSKLRHEPRGFVIFYCSPSSLRPFQTGMSHPSGRFRTIPSHRKQEDLPQIRRMPSGGGPEKLVVNVNEPNHPAKQTWFWRVTTQGIYFVDNSAKPKPLLKLYSFSTQTVSDCPPARQARRWWGRLGRFS